MSAAAGKVILFGEHAVVYGVSAVAAGIPKGILGKVISSSESRLIVPAWKLNVTPKDGSKVGESFDCLLKSMPLWAKNHTILLDSHLAPGAGLGSSAAMAVAIAKTLTEHAGKTLSDHMLLQAAMASESVFHKNPSGIDAACALQGGVLSFRKKYNIPKIEQLQVGSSLCFVIAHVEAGADTGKMVESVAVLRKSHLPVITSLLDVFEKIFLAAKDALAKGNHQKLGELMTINHGLLVAIGVSTQRLNRACHAAKNAGAYGAKLTGSGGGGSMVALVPKDKKEAVIAALQEFSSDPFAFLIRGSHNTKI